jgi:predicted dehydrogenase
LKNKSVDYSVDMYYIKTFQNGQFKQEYSLEKIKVGVVGTGHLGRFHTLNYAQIPDAELVGVTDLDFDKAQRVASEGRCEAFKDIDALLERIDAVSIVVPTDRHFEVGEYILERKIHCLIEKPITETVTQAENLIRLAEQKGLILHVGHVERFNPAIRVLEGMEITPRFIESHRLAPFNPRGTEVAVVLDLMIHDIDIILSVVKSPVVSVNASGVNVVSDSADIANARIRFENGCVANLTASRISQKKMRKMRLFQKDTYISVDFLQRVSEIYQLSDTDEKSDMVLDEIGIGDKKKRIVYQRPAVPEEQGLKSELEAFIRTIKGEHPPAVTGKEGKDALAVATRVLEQIDG